MPSRSAFIAAWLVGAVGVLATAISIGPSVVGASFGLSDDPAAALVLLAAVLVVAALEFAVPVFAGMAVANARGRWVLCLICAIIPIIVVWGIAPFFGSLGIFWGPRYVAAKSAQSMQIRSKNALSRR